MQRRSFLLAGVLGTAAAHRGVLAADDFPVRPVRVVVPYAAGGGPDVQMRQLAPRLGEALGQPIVVENKVGAGGVLGAQFVATAPKDGYTVLYGASTHLVQKAMTPDLKLDMLREFAPVTLMGSSPTVLVVRGDSPMRTLDDLLTAARARPGEMNYSSGGIGTAAHLAGATIVALADLRATHVPLRGSVEIQASLQRGDTQFACPIAGTAVPLVKGGQMRALAVTGRQRLKELPNVPTLHELMKSELAVQESWFALLAPAGTPEPVVTRLHAATRKAMQDPAVIATLQAGGTEAATSETPAALRQFMQQEFAKWAEIVKLTKVSST